MTLLVICTLSLACLFLLAWLSMTIQSKTSFHQHLLAQTQSQLALKDQEIQRLTNLLVSKDPMTFQILSQAPTTFLNSEPYQSTGSDQAEYEKWMKAQGFTVPDEEDFTQDLVEMGL